MEIPVLTALSEFHRAMPEQWGPLRKVSYACSHCRTGVALLLFQSSLVELAAEIAVTCSNLPLESSTLFHTIHVPHPAASSWELQHTSTSLPTVTPSRLLGLRVLTSPFSYMGEHNPSTTLARHLPPASQYTKGRTPPCLHFMQENMYRIDSGKKLLDASVTNAVCTAQPPQCLQRHTYSYEEGKLQTVISFPAEICN